MPSNIRVTILNSSICLSLPVICITPIFLPCHWSHHAWKETCNRNMSELEQDKISEVEVSEVYNGSKTCKSF